MADQAPAGRGQGPQAGVQVLVDVQLFHLDRPFTYRQPAGVDPLALGTRVKVPFGRRKRVDGWVVGPATEVPEDAKEILRVVSPVPAFGRRELALARWVADRWAGSLADALRLVLPPRIAAVEQARQGHHRHRPRRPGPRTSSSTRVAAAGSSPPSSARPARWPGGARSQARTAAS